MNEPASGDGTLLARSDSDDPVRDSDGGDHPPQSDALETQNAPEEEISLNPEALRVQYQSQARAVLERAVEFIRRQGSSTKQVVDILAYKALKEEVAGFAMVSYELSLQETLVRLATQQQLSASPASSSEAPAEETPPVGAGYGKNQIEPSSQE